MKTQQREVYAAQESMPDRGQWLHSLEEVRTLVDKARNSSWWWPTIPFVEVHERRVRDRWAATGGWDADRNCGVMTVRLPVLQLSVVHELAHITAEVKFGSKSHDPYWAREYLEMTYHLLGSPIYVSLWSAFKAYGVDADPTGGR